MWKSSWGKKLNEVWLTITIKKKIGVFIGAVFLIIFLSVLFDFWVVKFLIGDFQTILEGNSRSSNLMEAIEIESKSFERYIRSPNENVRLELEEACSDTALAIELLPNDYELMSEYRYAKTWSIKNSYEVYEKKRDYVLTMEEESSNYIKQLYEVYDIQVYLQDYTRALMRYTLEDEKVIYIKKVPIIKCIPFVILLVAGILIWIVIALARLMYKTLISPIVDLVKVSKKIAGNEFFIEDVKVNNKDEMGELVRAFNKMKYAVAQYIITLEEKRKTLDLLHKEEMKRLKVEKRLDSIKLELLKSQINPHFLFNTLNVIAGMANLEEANTTERMIKALSSIFRYNLKTPEAEVTLARELRIIKDYMYLQQMRFGSRINFSIQCNVDSEKVIVPTFSFQPLVENAIIHGLSKKEEGGKILIRIWQKSENLIITVTDSGVGMTNDKVKSLKKAFVEGDPDKVGIGLGNIYKRVNEMYKNGRVDIFSKEDIGTIIRLVIPQGE